MIDMNVYEDGRWGECEKLGAVKSRELALQSGVPYVDLQTYPREEIVGYFGTDYFSNTVDYAIALAVYQKYTDINLYGVNMAFGSEYAYQKAGVDYWCGQAMGRGIKVKVFSKLSTIMKTRNGLMYGYDIPQRSTN